MHLKQYVISSDRCDNCRRCQAVCPAGAVKTGTGGLPVIDRVLCRRCGACRRVCRQQAVKQGLRLQL